MARGHARSAKTGRYVSKATVARHPRATVTESTSGKGGKAYRSAITGRYVTKGHRAAAPEHNGDGERLAVH